MIITFYCTGIILLIFSLLPFIRKDHWTFRVFEYPRIQKLVLTLLWLGFWLIFSPKDQTGLLVLGILMLANTIYLLFQILPFTLFGKKQVLKAKEISEENSLKIMISNVYEDNDNYQGCLTVIRQNNPDLLLLLETNHAWAREMERLDQDYPHAIKVPIDNTYGMLLFSKFPLANSEVKYLVEEHIPSIHTQLSLPSGQAVQIYAVHPTPPVPNENPRSTERDKELLLVADMAKASDLPVVVIGDLNDVAWSYTTELFLKMSELLDPRRGRGFFNTFHAKQPLLQFPLDHAFISAHFKFIEMRKLNNFDSDHYPFFVHISFSLENENQQEDKQLVASQDDKELAEEKKQADTE